METFYKPKENCIPRYIWVVGTPDKHGSIYGCNGCAFRHMIQVRCSQIPCQKFPGKVAKLV